MPDLLQFRMQKEKTGIILLNLGGPEKLADVAPFLYNLFSDREIIRLRPCSVAETSRLAHRPQTGAQEQRHLCPDRWWLPVDPYHPATRTGPAESPRLGRRLQGRDGDAILVSEGGCGSGKTCRRGDFKDYRAASLSALLMCDNRFFTLRPEGAPLLHHPPVLICRRSHPGQTIPPISPV